MFELLSALVLTLAGVPLEVTSVVTANNQFALDLYHRLSARDGNLFFSPYTLHKTLTMAWAGARGETASEMASVLHLSLGQAHQHQAYQELRNLLNRSYAAQRGVRLSVAANVWTQRGNAIEKNFRNLLQECYGSDLKQIDFYSPPQARRTINAWVEKQTHGKVPELFGPDALQPTTRLVLASAIAFQGDWVHAFSKSQTRPDTFHVHPTEAVPVSLMNQTARFAYFEDARLQCLELPYAGGNLAMLVLLPKKAEGLAELETLLTVESLAAYKTRLREQKVEVALPKFRMTGELALAETLDGMGMRKAFQSGAADFSGIDGGREPLGISAVAHHALVDVHEEGTEAAAASGVIITTLSAQAGPAVPVFRADHPFVFAVYDRGTGLVLFLGRMTRP
jgi:serpin B